MEATADWVAETQSLEGEEGEEGKQGRERKEKEGEGKKRGKGVSFSSLLFPLNTQIKNNSNNNNKKKLT